MGSSLPLNPNESPNVDSLNITPPDLSSAVTLLDDLASAAEATLRSVSALLSPSSTTFELFSGHDNVLACPYDSHHRMLPEHLFRHALRCPSAPGSAIPELSFLEAAHYPVSLKSEAELRRDNTNRFSGTEPGAADLCLSLDGELGDVTAGGAGFFYRDCPGVVSFPELDASRSIFTLPKILSVHCDDFKGGISDEIGDFGSSARILPSELWAVKLEVGAWGKHPSSYSFAMLRAIFCLDALEERSLRNWLISTSCRHGILLDCAMRDHIFVLLKLCLKAIWSEAAATLGKLSSESLQPELNSLYFDCPCLLGSMSWLASTISILYGDASGRSFSIDMLKEAVLQSGLNSLIFANNTEKPDDSKEASEGGEKVMETLGPRMCCSPVFVSQVAAAVTALHERSFMETKIKDLRFPQSHNKTQILMDHSQTSTRANEERFRRPNYRAIIEHDGIIAQPSSNKDQNKPKTKEELLAEERDYKRRRMSYRGKKNKRTPNEVLHDIIEEHMEEIRRAGGIMSPTKISVDTAGLEHLNSSLLVGSVTSSVDEKDSLCSRKRTYKNGDGSCKIPEDGHNSEMAYTSHHLRERVGKLFKYNQSPKMDSRRVHDHEGERETRYEPHSRSSDQLPRHHMREKYEQSESIFDRRKNERRYVHPSKPSAGYKQLSHGKSSSRENFFEDFWPEGHGRPFEDRYEPSSSSDIHDNHHSYSSRGRYHKSDGQKDEHSSNKHDRYY